MVVSYDSSYYRNNKGGLGIQSHPTLLDDYLTSWKKAFLTDVTSFDRSQLRPFLGIRVGIMVIIPLVIRLLTNPTPVYILVCLGVFYVIDTRRFSYKVVSNARAFTY